MQSSLIRKLSHLRVNPVVKAYVIADTLLWSAWNLTTPIFAIFVVTKVIGGNIETAATGYSVYLISRVIFELLSARYLAHKSDKKKFAITVTGMLCMSSAYIGFAYSQTVFEIFLFYAMAGMGLGIATPAKNVLFASHLDKNREATEWGVTDAIEFVCMAIATMIGGIVAHWLGFTTLFLLAAIVNLVGTLPYLRFMPRGKEIELPFVGK